MIKLEDDAISAYETINNTNKHVFITGKAGTGKSTLLEYFKNNTRKNVVTLAPTGVAALNVMGQTIHSFFNFYVDVSITKIKSRKIRPRNPKLYRKIDTIVIDEVSMLRADLHDCINEFLKIYGPKPGMDFGGVQMVYFGDLYQLPPVINNVESKFYYSKYNSPYFYSAECFDIDRVEIFELEKIYRQKDNSFIKLLNKIRNNTVSDEDISAINNKAISTNTAQIHLTTTNKIADIINEEFLENLPGDINESFAELSGDVKKDFFPNNEVLEFKIGCQVMMLSNDPKRRWVNGSIGTIEDIKSKDDKEYILVSLDNGKFAKVEKHSWEVFKFRLDKDENIVSEVAGSFKQYPFKLAWAVTIHKSQGKTFDNVIIDIGRGTFNPGQLYVALSRCTSIEGITLKTPVQRKDIYTDNRIVEFLTNYYYTKSEQELPLTDKIKKLSSSLEKKESVDIIYLRSNNEKYNKKITPLKLKTKTLDGINVECIEAFCRNSNKNMLFRIDRIIKFI